MLEATIDHLRSKFKDHQEAIRATTANIDGTIVWGADWDIIVYFKLTIYAKLLVLWSVLQHELYAELKSYGQLYMYGYRGNFLVCPKLVLLWSVST